MLAKDDGRVGGALGQYTPKSDSVVNSLTAKWYTFILNPKEFIAKS